VETKNFRDGWTKFLTHQIDMTTLWTQIYSPVPGEGKEKTYYETPASTIASIDSYTGALTQVRETLLPILNGLDVKVIEPSMDMKKALEAVQKMVKKRHHKKMDYDRFTGSVLSRYNLT
jgi:amphiphysin